MKRPELQEWVEALKRGERVPLCRPIPLWAVFLALALYLFLLPLVLQIGDGKWDAAGLKHFLLFCLAWCVFALPMWLIWPWFHLAAKNRAVQLEAEALASWDWRRREYRVPWREMTSLRVVWGRGSTGLVVRYSQGARARQLLLRLDDPVQGSLWNPPRVERILGDAIAAHAGLVAERDRWGDRTTAWVRPGPEAAAQ